jgi:hypothetical protein
MNKTAAKKIARSGITSGQIKKMLKRAYDAGAAGNSRSGVNPGFSKAAVFNILWNGHMGDEDNKPIKGIGDVLGAQNALREFGEYWEGNVPRTTRRKKPTGDFHHEPAIDIYKKQEAT